MAGCLKLVVLICTVIAHVKAKVPVLHVEGSYQGSVSEKGGTVDLTPPLKSDHGPICGYRITNNRHGRIPFEVFMIDELTGEAELRARRPLDCETEDTYSLTIQAVACTGEQSQRGTVNIAVRDVNEYMPEWRVEEYSGQIQEGDLADEIITLDAVDRDCSPTFGRICSYRISTPDQPFTITEKGVLRNTVPLSAQESRNHVFSVVATDCGGKDSSPILVTIAVLPHCVTSWTDVSTSMTYVPGTGPQPVFPQAKFQVCPGQCKPARIETTLTLHTQDKGVGCDRDTYSLHSQKKICGASRDTVDILPSGNEWAEKLKYDEDDKNGVVYKFDGHSGVIIPRDVAPHHFGKEFTVSTWMRHQVKNQEKHSKEHILCLADDHRKNRHHFAMFIRNCKLVVLFRREYVEEERNVFKPAEWRWALPQTCDNKWHHYSVIVSTKGVELIIDGEPLRAKQNNPEVIDDWPLHPASDLKTTLTAGGCWQGSDMKMRHQFKGFLAGLSVLPNKQEYHEVMRCIVECGESLQLPATNLLDPGMEMITNTHGNQVTIDGKDPKNMQVLVGQIAYLNTREYPAPGSRKLEMNTVITCQEGTKIEVPMSVSRVLVLPVLQPTIQLKGTTNITRNYEQFKDGVRIFEDMTVSFSEKAEGSMDESMDNRVDKCMITVFPPLNPDHEKLNLPELMLKTMNIDGIVGDSGAEFRGVDDVMNYEDVLKSVTYSNQKPAYYLNRQFKLTCSQVNDRFTSNEYTQTVTVEHPPVYTEQVDAAVAHRQVSQHSAEIAKPKFISNREYMSLTGQNSGHAVMIIVGVCVCLLAVVLILGMTKLRSVQKKLSADEAEVEMAWDDTALNITVNPLEDMGCSSGSTANLRATDSELEDMSDDELYGDEDDSSDEDDDEDMDGVAGAPSRHRLEWDNDL